MRRVLIVLILTLLSGCNKVQEECQECPKDNQEYVAWDQDTTSYDAIQVEDTEPTYNDDPTIWVYDGEDNDTLATGDILRVSSIDGAEVHIKKIP